MQRDAEIAEVKKTFEDWSLFDTVIRHNYMYHRELAEGIQKVGEAASDGLRIVDLGCGDAWLVTHAFAKVPVEQYQGVDLSESAVARARANVATLQTQAEISCGNIAEFVTSLADDSASLILASYSLHHFSSEQKAELVRQCFRVLSSGGVFCWIDPVRRDDESREAYLHRIENVMQHDWTELSEEQRRRAIAHVWASDFPETEVWMRQCVERAGFLFEQSFLASDLFGAFAYTKLASSGNR